MAVLARQLGADDDHHAGDAAEQPEHLLEHPRRQPHVGAAGVAVADEPGQLLAHAEHEALAAGQGQQREHDRVGRVGAQDPHDVHPAQHPPEPPHGGGQRPHDGAQVSAAGVVGQRLRARCRASRRGSALPSGPGGRSSVTAPEVARQRLEEQAEGQLGGDHVAVAAVGEVAEHRQAGRSASSSDRRVRAPWTSSGPATGCRGPP